jgi:hypothetical protein
MVLTVTAAPTAAPMVLTVSTAGIKTKNGAASNGRGRKPSAVATVRPKPNVASLASGAPLPLPKEEWDANVAKRKPSAVATVSPVPNTTGAIAAPLETEAPEEAAPPQYSKPLPPAEAPLFDPMEPLDFSSDPRQPNPRLDGQDAYLRRIPEPPAPEAPI